MTMKSERFAMDLASEWWIDRESAWIRIGLDVNQRGCESARMRIEAIARITVISVKTHRKFSGFTTGDCQLSGNERKRIQ